LTRSAAHSLPGLRDGRTVAGLKALVRLWALCLLLFACGAGTGAHAAAATSYVFDGSKVAGCQLSSSTYTCNNFPLTNDTDKMTIASGYTVLVKSNVAFTYNQSLTMSGSATLNATGNLSIGDINPPNLSITGGNLVSGGTFTIGNQAQSITADINAVTMNLGSGSRTSITGDVTASGNVTVGSYCTINGALSGAAVTTNSPVTITGNVSATKSFALASGSKVSGDIVAPVVTTDSPVTIVGNVTASTSFTLASGSKVSGDIVSPTVSLLASQSTVNGKINARTSLQLGDKVSVTGDVTAGNLTLDSANAIINGNATVGQATLNWAGRVTKTIYCTGGTTNGQCDCVTNNSGFPVNTDQGPHCAAVQPAAPIDHFLIVHDGSASACTPEPVTVKACANAACTSLYTGGVTVSLQPGGGNVTIGPSGMSNNASVSQSVPGTAALAINASSVAAANALQCNNTANGSGSCSMAFNGSIGLSLTMQDHYSAKVTPFTLKAAVSDPQTQSCAPAFAGQQKTILLSCTYSDPKTGSQPVKVSSAANVSSPDQSFLILNGANAGPGTCNGTARDFPVTFDSKGSVTFSMYYVDVGKISINASTADNSAPGVSRDVVVAPAAFMIPGPISPTTAGNPFDFYVRPLNAEGKATPNFGQEAKPETVSFSLGALDTVGCKLKSTDLGKLSVDATKRFATDVWVQLVYTEAGALNVKVEQASDNYLGGAKPRPAAVQTSLGGASGCGAITSVPAYFEVRESRGGTGDNAANFYYSGEPVDVTVTAKNSLGNTTTLYDNSFGYSKAVVFTAYDAAGGSPIPSGTGRLSGTGSLATSAAADAPLSADTFSRGVAKLRADAASPLVFTLLNPPTAPLSTPSPLKVRLRAAETGSGGVSSANAGAGGEDVYEARVGRVSIGSRFGSAKGNLVLPLTLQYWNGYNWIQNLGDSHKLHPIRLSAIALQAAAPLQLPSITADIDPDTQGILMTNGAGSLTLRPTGGIGTAAVAVNLGAGSADTACLPAPRPATTGARMPWLRGRNGSCNATPDPSARATFGVYPPEAKRLIHTREVFN
jgi:MSHA biogenesis protein MshQ